MTRRVRGGLRVTGLNQVVRDLIAIGLEVEDLKEAFAAVADRGALLASSYAPKLSGALAGDIRGSRARNKAVITAGRKRIPYAGALNYGWRDHNIVGSSYMQKADRALRPFAAKQINTQINTQIRRRGLG